MKIKKLFIFSSFLIILALNTLPSFASDWENLCKDGFGAVEKTSIREDFKGCEYGKEIPFEDGLGIRCTSYNYHYAYHPEVYILKNIKNGQLKFVIDGNEFEGVLLRFF